MLLYNKLHNYRGLNYICSDADAPPCMDYEFTCESGHCIPIRFLCDGEYDCGPGDFTDENNKNCEGKTTSYYYIFTCPSYFLSNFLSSLQW